MSQELERVYTVPLGKVLLSQSQHRAVRAINMIREFARKHMKTQEIKIDEEVAHLIWSKGVRSPPRKIRVRMTKTDDGFILVSKYEGESESEEKDTKKSPEIKQEPELQIEDPDAIEVTEETLKEETTEIEKPKIEVHISNIYSRDDYRRKSITSTRFRGWISRLTGVMRRLRNLIRSSVQK